MKRKSNWRDQHRQVVRVDGLVGVHLFTSEFVLRGPQEGAPLTFARELVASRVQVPPSEVEIIAVNDHTDSFTDDWGQRWSIAEL